MSYSEETQKRIKQFAKEQAPRYLETAEMTYMEQLQVKARQMKHKIGRKLARFRSTSDQVVDAQNDMILYMSDYLNDLMAQGLSEQEAFEKAKQQLLASSDSDRNADLHERLRKYYEDADPAAMEAIGLVYGGMLFLGIAIGGLTGLLIGGGIPSFLAYGWIYTLVGIAVGAFIGLGIGLLGNALIVAKMRR